MTLLPSIQLPPVAHFLRLGACSLLALFAASSSACSPSATESSSDSEAEADVAFDGLWRAWPDGHGSFDVNIEAGKARIVRFGPGFEIGNPEVLNGGDPLLTRLTRLSARKFSARVARLEFAHSPALAKDWPTSVTYVDTTLEWNEGASRWTISEPKIELSKQSSTFDGEYAPAGACEKKFENHDNATLYICEYPQDSDGCSSAGEKAFWPSTDCERLGYGFLSNDIGKFWQESETNNVTPGAHGEWGDGSGGQKMVSTAAAATGDDVSSEDPDPSTDVQGGEKCLLGTWRTDTCDGAKTHTLSFTTDSTGKKTGHYVMPDCNDVCTTPLDYHYDYEVDGENVTLIYTGSSEIRCNGSPVTPPPPTSNDTFSFSCVGDTLTTTTSLGSKTYTRVK